MPNLSAPDLSAHPPRSPRVKLGGYVHLPRLLDKARASAAGKAGEYHYNCPLDRHFFDFTGIDHEVLLAEVRAGKSDSEILEWIRSKTKRLPYEVAAWSEWFAASAPGGAAGHEWFAETIKACAVGRTDVNGFFDLLDLDDYVSFGGRG